MFFGKLSRILGITFVVLASFPATAQTVGLLREVWEGINGTDLSALTSSANYPNRPTSKNYVTDYFESPTDILENYGQRMHGYVVPPLTGNYTFWVATDDQGALYLSSDENPANSRLIASVNGWTPPRQWEVESNQRSAAIRLVAGKAYYVSALMKEGGGGDNLAVRWLMPNGVDQAPIVATNLLPFGVSFTAPSIARHPANTTAVEGAFAPFTVGLSSVGPVSYSWRRNGVALPDSNTPDFLFGPVRLADQGARFNVVVSNSIGSVTSSQATLSVTPDVTRPTVTDVINLGTRNLRITFSEPVAVPSATSAANFTISPGITVDSARLGASSEIVELEVSELTLGSAYVLAVQGVLDRAQTPNSVAPGTRVSFTALEYTPGRVGSPSGNGSVNAAPGGVDITSGGVIGDRSDAFEFGYQQVTGNFDRRVRVATFTPSDPFALAGLMARATLDADSPFAAAVATPGVVGAHLLSRSTPGANSQRAGSFPVNYPQTWLRLARSGSTFRAFAGFDGAAWTELGSVNLNLPSTLFLGFAVGGRDPVRTATAEFRDAGNASGAPAPPVTTFGPRRESPGPSSRLAPLVISEVMYHPRKRADGRDTEFIEIHNADLIDQDLTGHRISGAVDFQFPKGFVLPAGGFAVIARSPTDLAAIHGLSNVLGPFEGTNNLPNDNGTIRLRNPQGAVLLEVPYDSRAPWPVAADGAGHSLVLARPSYGEGDPRAWSASASIGGSPGAQEIVRANSRATALINEVLAHTDLPQLDLVELHNHGNDTLDLGGCFLTDDPSTNRFRIPIGTWIPPRGFLAFNETQLGFRLDAAGESLFLVDADESRVLDAIRFGAQENGVSTGRYPDGTPEWRRLSSVTAGSANTPFRVSPVVLNEILYNPISGDSEDEFVELFNRSASPVALDDWSFTDGIDFRFPTNTVIGVGAHVVVAKNRTRLLAGHPGLSPAAVFGDYGGTLANGGERIALAMPDFIATTNELGVVQTRRIDIEVAEVTYGTGGRWGQWSDGLGSSLELIDPYSDALQASNWADSDESAKAPWTTIEFTGRVDNVASGVSSSRLHLLAQGPGEYLIDDIQVLAQDGANRLSNGDFGSGLTGWTVQGNHRRSSLAASEGIAGSNALRVRATGRGDTAVNRVRATITPSLTANSTATLRARVRWIRGWPEFLLRTLGNGIEAFGRLEIPRNLGTPGARNSRAVDNAGPAIFDVSHAPAVPAGGEAVLVTARVTDPDGVDSVSLRYRQDPSNSLTTVIMRDDGSAGDAVAGDGVYSGRVPGRAAGVLVAFTISASDQESNPASSQFPTPTTFPAPATREGLIRWGETKPFGNLGVYRFWQRQADANSLRSREPLANDPLDCTFVHGDERVIYNAEMRAKGSPWHGGSVGGDYVFTMPDDDRLLGARDLAIVTLGNLGNDGTAQREQAAFWIGRQLGAASLHRRHIHFFENGGFKGLYEDTEEPNGLYVDRWFPDGEDGDLFKIEDWFEFNDSGGSFVFSRDATLERFTTVGNTLKQARYRWAWRKRAIQGSANDYSNLLQLVETVANTSASNAPRIEAVVDIENWMRAFALQHIVGNWDAYGYGRGKNSYAYLPTGGRWKIIPWDIDFVLGLSSDGPTTDVFSSVDPTISRLWNIPSIRRAYWRAFQDAVTGPLAPGNVEPVLDDRYAALVANGFNVENPGPIKEFIRQRRSYLSNRAASEDTASLAITSNNGADFTTSNPSVTLAGRAPIALQTLLVNGVAHPVRWTTVTSWSLEVALGAPVNRFEITGLNSSGEPVPGASDSVTVRYTGSPIDPVVNVFINEWMASNSGVVRDPADGDADDWFELHNAGGAPADLSGYTLTDTLTEPAKFTIPQGTVLPPGGFLLVWADEEPQQTGPGEIHVNFRLAGAGEALGLFAPNGSRVDTITFGVQTENLSQGRFPDGQPEPFLFLDVPTPGEPNTTSPANKPPVFDRVSLQSTEELAPFSLVLAARDPDTPPKAVIYQLEAAPPGAALDPASGLLTWTPTEDDGPGSYQVTVRATKAATEVSSTLTFSIVVQERNEAPILAPIPDFDVLEGTEVRFTARASDSDRPAQRLTYRLATGAPEEASVDPQTGVLTWPIPTDAGASTNRITIEVTDDAIGPRTATQTFTVIVRPVFRGVIHEIQYAAATPEAEFIELFNPSETTGWDLGGWRLTGLDFNFPAETRLGPTNYLVVARNQSAFRATHGPRADVLGDGVLTFTASGPQFVRLQRPTPGGIWETMDEVSFLRETPWPSRANGGGSSLQLIDAAQDNRRLANWSTASGGTTNPPVNVIAYNDLWRFKQDGAAPVNWRDSDFNDDAWPGGRGLLYVEDSALPGPKTTALTRTEGRFTYYFRTRFTFTGNPEGASLVLRTILDDGAVVHLNGEEIFRLGVDTRPTIDSTPASRTVSDATEEGPFIIPAARLVPGENVLAVEVHQINATSSDIVWGAQIEVIGGPGEASTPGYANSTRAVLPPFPDVWINEVQPLNTTGITDNAGDREPWIELVHRGDVPLDLAGWWLTDDPTNLTKWAFPGEAALSPRSFRVIWSDAEPAEQTPTDWHTSFRIAAPSGTVALVRPQLGVPAIVDFVTYSGGVDGASFGSSDLDDPLIRGPLATPTPGSENATNDLIRITTIDLASPREVRLGWTSVFGRRYRVDSRVSLGDPWIPATKVLVAEGSSLTTLLARPDTSQAYFRVVRVE